MDEKIEAVSAALSHAFPNARLEYRFSDELHKFRLDFPKYTHWLVIGRETMEDSDANGLRDLFDNYQVIRTLQEAHFSKRILLTRTGVQDQPIPES